MRHHTFSIDENWAPYCFTFSTDRFLPINYYPNVFWWLEHRSKRAFVSEIRNTALGLNFHDSLSHYMGWFQGLKTCLGLPEIMAAVCLHPCRHLFQRYKLHYKCGTFPERQKILSFEIFRDLKKSTALYSGSLPNTQIMS